MANCEILPAFKGISDHGNEKERHDNREQSTKNSCAAQLRAITDQQNVRICEYFINPSKIRRVTETKEDNHLERN
jgi:hypothetical protein